MRVTRIVLALALSHALAACAGDSSEPQEVATSSDGLVSRVEVMGDWLSQADKVEVRWTLSNEGSETVFLPRWEVPAAEIQEDLFHVELDGQPVAYIGRHYKRPAITAADLVAIEPGASLSAVVDISDLYDTQPMGEYAVAQRFEHGHELRSNLVSAIRFEPGLPPLRPLVVTPGYQSCSSSRQSSISSALSAADTYAANSLAYLNAGTAGARYKTWFGTYNSSRYNTVKSHFSAIRSTVANKKITFNCSCTDSAYAYVYPNSPYVVYLCNAFWSAPTKGTDSKAGTIIHELSHFNVVAGTNDWAYGQSAAKSLASSSPSKAVDNADSHEYFAENTPFQN